MLMDKAQYISWFKAERDEKKYKKAKPKKKLQPKNITKPKKNNKKKLDKRREVEDILNPTEWFITKMGKKCTPSVAELKIINVLNGFEYLKYYMEVSFKGLKSGNSYYRFDFFIPKYNLIIEYDGACHNTKKSKESDNIKNNFCKKYNIKIFRFNKLHWRDLETHIIKLIVTKCPK